MTRSDATRHPMRRLLSERRGLLAGAAALVGAGLAKLVGAERSEAAHDTGGSPEVLHAGVVNTVAGQTNIHSSVGQALLCQGTDRGLTGVTNNTSGARIGVVGTTTSFTSPNDPCGVYGYTLQGHGVHGTTSSGFGVKGVTGVEGLFPNTTAGVWGTARDTNGVIGTSTQFSGVIGISVGAGPGMGPGYGVVGTSTTNVGVFGSSTSNIGVSGRSTNHFGVYGRATTSVGTAGDSDQAEGVFGVSATGIGTRGESTMSFGVLGNSTNGIGVRGTGRQFGVWGHSQNGSGVYATSTSNSALVAESQTGLAAEFRGNVYVTGTITAASKSAVVTLPDGTARRLYCMEAPEALFEDVGRDRLVGGAARVALDPTFAATIRSDEYDVFLTPYGDCRGLYVTNRTPAGFEVRELGGGTSSLDFGYRVVATRRNPHGARLDRVDVPANRARVDVRIPDRPTLPNLDANERPRPTAPDSEGRPSGRPERPDGDDQRPR